ncbi:MAG: iron-containing redox enzyme family protein [Kofleriaceae bacterium]
MNDELRAIPLHMADQVRALLPAVTLAGYQRFLDHMFHYTRGSEARLVHAADHAQPALQPYFRELAADERSHYRLAEADLATFGQAPSAVAPASIDAFDRAWRDLSTPGWLGALYALESVAEHIAADAARNLARLDLRKEQARFIFVHLQADVEHGAGAADHVSALPPSEQAAALAAARIAGDFWIALHTDAFA